jgi:glycosyltransferase involved in cell wall biosynthesis
MHERSKETEPARPLRVCHLAYTFYENDNRVIRYAEAMAAKGADVDVIALRRNGQSRQGMHGQVRVHRIQRRAVTEKRKIDYFLKIIWFFIQSSVVLAALHARRRYDVVHVHNVPDFLVFAAFVPKLTGARVILDIHDILPELYAGKFGSEKQSATFRALLHVERSSCRFADHVVIANHLWHTKLINRSVDETKCTTIMNYPDLRRFKPNERQAGAGSNGRDYVILYPGTLNVHQGLDVAIKAFGRASMRMPTAQLHIYGEGPARKDLVTLTRDLGLESRVKIMDRVPFDEVGGLMAAADLGVVPKRAEGFGGEAFSTKILEFMACGVPVLVSRTQVDAFYFDNKVVRFFTSGDDAELAELMVWAYEHRAEHEDWIAAGLACAERYSWQARMVDYQAIIESLVTGAARRRAVAF